MPYGSLMVGDGTYLYIAYRSNSDEGGLYRAKMPVKSLELLDRGKFSSLCLHDKKLYYIEDGQTSDTGKIAFHCMDTQSLEVATVNEGEYGQVRDAVNPGWNYSVPKDVRMYTVVGDEAYCLEELEEAEVNDGKRTRTMITYSLSSFDKNGNLTQTGITWQHWPPMDGVISAYGDYAVYTKTWKDDPKADSWSEARAMPCFYNTQTGEETLLVRDRSIQVDVCAINASSGYLLVSHMDDVIPDGDTLDLESLSDPDVIINLDELVESATPAQAFAEREAEERAAEEEALRNEPYGPGTSTLHLSAPENKSACYRLVRMDGSTEFIVLLEPGEKTVQKFPCGRYTLKTAEGDTWISDEEAFGPDGHYSTTDVFYFQEGGSYEISTGTRGDFRKDNASGFTG